MGARGDMNPKEGALNSNAHVENNGTSSRKATAEGCSSCRVNLHHLISWVYLLKF